MSTLACTACIVGEQRLINELLADHLSSQTGLSWSVHSHLHQLPPVASADAPSSACRRLVLWDVQDLVPVKIAGGIMDSCLDTTEDALALFNLLRSSGVAESCLSNGIRGLFYVDDNLEWVTRGVRVLLEGQVWLTPNAVAAPPMSGGLPAPWSFLISRREREALEYVLQGRTNQEIAEAMAISPHTVKTHLYRLYKKIGISSRLEAVIWYRTHIAP